jgi:hypothetical protein
LNAAWLAIGERKLRLRRLYFEQGKKFPLKRLFSLLREANDILDRLLDEMLKRQINEFYYSKPKAFRCELPAPNWKSNYSYLRRTLPSVFD